MPHFRNRAKSDFLKVGVAVAFPARPGVRMPVQSEAEPDHGAAEALPLRTYAGLRGEADPRLGPDKLGLDVSLFRVSHLNVVPRGTTIEVTGARTL